MKYARCVGDGPFQLCFRSLFDSGRGYAFPCDGIGRVDLDKLSERARNNYLYARAMVGRELGLPAVESRAPSSLDDERVEREVVHELPQDQDIGNEGLVRLHPGG